MNEMKKRTLVGIGVAGASIAVYFFSIFAFIGVLIAGFLFVLAFEWPQFVGGCYCTLRSWYLTIAYPIVPFCALIYYIWLTYPLHFLAPLYPFIIASVHDSAAYFFGVLFGKHKMAPAISPKKTWEGFVGGLLSVTVTNFILLPFLSSVFSTNILFILLFSVVATITLVAGDLFVSLLKRKTRIKDTGAIMPGHGGLLDRLDSVLFFGVVCLVVALLNVAY